jgi:hypothetical protein
MKANRIILIVALALAAFFLSQFAAELSFSLMPSPDSGKEFRQPPLAARAFSLSSRIFTDSAFSWLEARPDDAAVMKSVPLLRKALKRNPLDYRAHYFLAKAYLRSSTADNGHFELGVNELKRAARIRGSNKQIALDCGRIFFSLWPFLNLEDKAFTSSLLKGVMPFVAWNEFSPLLENWSLYVQDTALLMDLLMRKPDFFGPAANQLVAAGLPLPLRHEFLALYEVHTLDVVERRYNELNLKGEIGLDSVRSLLNRLLRLKGYYRLHRESHFNTEKFARLQRFLLLEVISGLLTAPGGFDAVNEDPQLRELIRIYISEHPELTSLDELQKLLDERNYFAGNDFSTLYLKTLINYRKGGYSEIIADIEALRKGISFVKKEQVADYTGILLLLVDSYFSSKLMTMAESVVGELVENQPDDPNILWRVLRVRKILGDEGAPDRELSARLAKVENSRFLTVSRLKGIHDVFLFNQPEIEIVFDPALRAGFKTGKLLQVFVDGKIAFEAYADAVPEKIVIGKPFTEVERKVQVQVALLQ